MRRASAVATTVATLAVACADCTEKDVGTAAWSVRAARRTTDNELLGFRCGEYAEAAGLSISIHAGVGDTIAIRDSMRGEDRSWCPGESRPSAPQDRFCTSADLAETAGRPLPFKHYPGAACPELEANGPAVVLTSNIDDPASTTWTLEVRGTGDVKVVHDCYTNTPKEFYGPWVLCTILPPE